MSGLTVERLRRDGEQFLVELSREFYESHAGLKASAELQPLYAKYKGILGEEALELVRELFLGSAEGSEEHRSARALCDSTSQSSSARVSWRHRTSARSSGRVARWCGSTTAARSHGSR